MLACAHLDSPEQESVLRSWGEVAYIESADYSHTLNNVASIDRLAPGIVQAETEQEREGGRYAAQLFIAELRAQVPVGKKWVSQDCIRLKVESLGKSASERTSRHHHGFGSRREQHSHSGLPSLLLGKSYAVIITLIVSTPPNGVIIG